MQETLIARLKVTIKDIRPPIWRRVEVFLEFSFARLSDVILAAFGWSNSAPARVSHRPLPAHRHGRGVGGRGGAHQAPELACDRRPTRPFLAELYTSLVDEDEKALTLAQVLVGDVKRFVYTSTWAMTGSMWSSWRRSFPPGNAWSTRAARLVGAAARPRTAAASGAMGTSWRSSPTPPTMSTPSCATGVLTSSPKSSTWRWPMRRCATRHSPPNDFADVQ